MNTLKQALIALVPRFVTEDVALELSDDGYHPVCSMEFVEPGERFDGVITVRSFTWFGVCCFGKAMSEVRPWK